MLDVPTVSSRRSRRHLRLVVLSRPVTRADCKDGPRPCDWHACRFYQRRTHQCALDAAERGAHSAQELSDAMGLTLGGAKTLLMHAKEALGEVAEAMRDDDDR